MHLKEIAAQSGGCPYCKNESCSVCTFEKEWIKNPNMTTEEMLLADIDRAITKAVRDMEIKEVLCSVL